MALLALVIVALAGGLVAAAIASRVPLVRSRPSTARPDAPDVDPEAATGVALAFALALLIGGGLVLAVLTFVIRADADAIGLDTGAANWGDRHGTAFTTDVLEALTHLGQPGVVAAMAAVLAVVETVRTRNRWVAPFLLIVVAGNGIITTTIKNVADRVRPTLNPVAETLGPSFPSGHSSWSAAFFAAAALVLMRGRGPRAQVALTAVAAGLACAIAATRVLLDVHWLSDVVAGLALGWAWFAVCAIAFGGRLMRFGSTAERVTGRTEPAQG
jgi:undecaprenyl-diphosphatase